MKRESTLVATAIFVVSFIVYTLTLSPGVTFTDAGELAAVCSSLGVAHPTGYPLFTILGKLWLMLPLPFRDIYSLNLLAALLTALSAAVFYLNAKFVLDLVSAPKRVKEKPTQSPRDKKSKKRSQPAAQAPVDKSIEQPARAVSERIKIIGAAAVALLYAFGSIVWAQATSIEVYSLHLLMMNLSVYLLFTSCLTENFNARRYIIAELALGLSFANHLTTILLAPATIYLLILRRKDLFTRDTYKTFLVGTLAFLLGVSFYLYLPLRSSMEPLFNWGEVSRGFDKFLYHVSGKQYRVWMFSGSNVWKENFAKFGSAFVGQFNYLGIAAAFAGLLFVFDRSKKLFWFLAIMVVTGLIYSLNYSIHDIESYFLTTFMALMLFASAGIGVAYLRIIEPSRKNRTLFASLAFVLPLISIAINYSSSDRSEDYLVEEYTHMLVGELKPNAIVISSQWDFWCSAFWYMNKVEGYRPDVALLEKELMRRTWYPRQFMRWYPELAAKSAPEFNAYGEILERFESEQPYDPAEIQAKFVAAINSVIDKNYGKRPIYITDEVFRSDPDIAAAYEKIPEGLAFRLEKGLEPRKVSVDRMSVDRFAASSAHYSTSELEKRIRAAAAIGIGNVGRYALFYKDTAAARQAFSTALKIDPENAEIRSVLY